MVKNEYNFIEKNKDKWEKLNLILSKRKKSYDDLRELGELYLEAVEDLSYAQTHLSSSKTITYLNNLVRRCHLIFHRKKKARFKEFFIFLGIKLPKVIYSLKNPILVSLAVFLVGLFISFFMVKNNPEYAEMFVDSRTYEMVRSDLEMHEKFGNFDDIPKDSRVGLSFYLWIHNSRVSITIFVLGITLGVGSLILLLFNGFMLGSLIAIYYMNGHLADFLSLILVHGSIELTAIIVAGGAAFHLAGAVLFPNRKKRIERILENSKTALQCIFGVVFFLLWAGLMEGLVTPMKLPVNQRFTIGAVNFVLLILYFTLGYFIKKRDKSLQPASLYFADSL